YYAAADKRKPDNTSVLIFIGPAEVDVCAQAVKEIWDDKTKKGKQGTETVKGIASIVKEVRDFDLKNAGKKRTSGGRDDAEERPKLNPLKEIEDRIKAARVSADIALFGRMLAEQPARNTDGACRVAHPISTRKVDTE